ncbi:SurA N-terminal domain-containing protein [Acinetobacter bohemicus]|uniref:SurA N-terminal domain-containing protein n=1 Tax=Acinetobacter TaxID=469 RepID=UPI00157D80AD|nr:MULTISPECIES: SurA N-terminal domain-containing protein [Acinetobacter]MCO8042782.1 SurA N-terminal domain-containing protein [Acinetobacter sp. S4400-12]MCU7225117.1 SurA N-terminal domain-containing protein [Acinetobacter bohemicus]MDM1782081.1 SurA N-terminal domain-containing protein [Acinetobacter indicus]QKQ70162.1 peptidylprolyl isomerase [Acinetobacter sp. 10FS3-1]
MEAFRKVIKGWLGKVLLVLFLTPLALVGIEGYFSGGSSDAVSSVNGTDISQKELESLTKSFKQQYLSYTNGDETLLNQSFIEQKAKDTLIARTLLLQQAEKLGISLSKEQIEQMIAQQQTFQQNGQFSQALYENYLKSIGMTNNALIESLRTDHALKMLSSTFVDYPLVSRVDIQQIADLQTEQRQIHIASISLESYKKDVKVTEPEVAAYYEKHKAIFTQPTTVDVDYVVLKPENIVAEGLAVTDVELKQAYDAFVAAQKQNIKPEVKHVLITTDNRSDAEAKKLAAEVAAKIKAGTSFAQAAAQYSEDPESKSKGGEIAVYEAGVFGATFDQAVASLKSGQVSAPVKTENGYHLISVTLPQIAVPSFESQKARLSEEVLATKKSNAFSDTVNSLNDMIVSSDSLEVVAQEVKGVQVQSAKGVTLATRDPLLSDAAVKVKLFNDDVKNGDRNASSSIQLNNGDVVWIKVRDYHAAGEQTLAEAKPHVTAKLIEEKALNAAKAKIQKTLDEFRTKPAAAVTKGNLVFEDVGIYTRAEGLLKRDVQRAAFSVTPPKAGHWSVTTAHMPNELVVVAVSEVKKNPIDVLSAEQRNELVELYRQLRGQQEFDDYTRYLKSHAKIK